MSRGRWCVVIFSAGALVLGAVAGWLGPMAGDEAALLQLPTLVLLVLCVIAVARGWINLAAFLSFSLFLALHTIAAYYGYCNVPYDDWGEWAFAVRIGTWLDSDRNHFDRIIHFCYGLCLFIPARQVAHRALSIGSTGSTWIAIEFILASSLLYEVAEWLIAEFMAPDIAERYNGQQGDAWDAQKDMALALLGAVLAASLVEICRRLRIRSAVRD